MKASLPCTLAGAARMFWTHPSPKILGLALAISAPLRLWVGAWSGADLLVTLVILIVWPLQEWLIHVFILHFRPRRIFGIRIDPGVAKDHRAHHREPSRFELIFIPLHSYLYSLPLMVGLYALLAPSRGAMLTGLTIHILGSLHYEWVHFLVHTRYRPRTAYYERLWRNHRLHHFKNERFWMGVTRLSADGWLGTSPDPQTVAKSSTVDMSHL